MLLLDAMDLPQLAPDPVTHEGSVPRPPHAADRDLFQSFVMGGFECSTHVRRDGRRLDVLAGTRHDLGCAEDYALLAGAGLRTVRDGLRWHLIERVPGQYDWSSFAPMLRGAQRTGTQVIWDLCHWGLPAGLDVFGPEFPDRFAAFAAAAAAVICEENARSAGLAALASTLDTPGCSVPNVYVPINEISFWSWIGGDVGHFWPNATGRGPELKRQLVRASILAIRRIREVDPTARFVQPEPMIHVSAATAGEAEVEVARRHTEAQFEVWDMLAGLRSPELGGEESLLDLLGVNYYWDNQWVDGGERTPAGHPQHRPVHLMLAAIYERYRRPLLVSETGTEGRAQAGWLGAMMAEVRQAERMGVPMLGLCLYPAMDYPGWDDDRHCPCGLIEVHPGWGERRVRPEIGAEIAIQAAMRNAH